MAAAYGRQCVTCKDLEPLIPASSPKLGKALTASLLMQPRWSAGFNNLRATDQDTGRNLGSRTGPKWPLSKAFALIHSHSQSPS